MRLNLPDPGPKIVILDQKKTVKLSLSLDRQNRPWIKEADSGPMTWNLVSPKKKLKVIPQHQLSPIIVYLFIIQNSNTALPSSISLFNIIQDSNTFLF